MHFDGTRWSTWPKVRTGLVGFSVRLWGSSAANVWVAGLWSSSSGGAGQTILLHYDGARWESVQLPYALNAIWGSAASNVWAAGSGALLRFDGASWTPVANYLGGTADMWGSSASDVWAVAPDAIMHYNGRSWSNLSDSTCAPAPCRLREANNLQSVWGTSASNVWFLGQTAVHYSGGQWSPVPAEQTEGVFVRGVWGSGASDVWAVSGSGSSGPGIGAIHHYDGISWSRYPTPPDLPNLLGIWGSSAYDIWAVGDDGTLLHGSRAR